MVTFCYQCGTSLPAADVIIRNGEEQTAPDYECPACRKPGGSPDTGPEEGMLPDAEHDVCICRGKESTGAPETSGMIDPTLEPPAAPKAPRASLDSVDPLDPMPLPDFGNSSSG